MTGDRVQTLQYVYMRERGGGYDLEKAADVILVLQT